MLRATLLALAFVGTSSLSALANGLTAEQVVERVTVAVDANGNEVRTYALAEEVAPGDEVRYSLAYTNAGEAAADSVNLVMPVPSAVTYIESSASGRADELTFSSDGGKTFATRAALKTSEGDQERFATSADITHVKWAFSNPIAPAATGTVSFSAILK